jgi:pimeloyl-ACP methyl ester carboxylesterase
MQFLTALAIVLLPISLSAESKFFDSNGVQIHYYDEGEGEPVVLVHGGFSNAAMWDTLGAVDALEEAGWRVIALDMRGHGQSGKPHDPAKYGLEMSLDIGRLLDHLKSAERTSSDIRWAPGSRIDFA